MHAHNNATEETHECFIQHNALANVPTEELPAPEGSVLQAACEDKLRKNIPSEQILASDFRERDIFACSPPNDAVFRKFPPQKAGRKIDIQASETFDPFVWNPASSKTGFWRHQIQGSRKLFSRAACTKTARRGDPLLRS